MILARPTERFFKVLASKLPRDFLARATIGKLQRKGPMKNVPLAVFALTMAVCRADLFDNEAQLAVKYGKPAQISGDSRLYHWGGIYVAVQLKEIGQGFKVSVSEAYKRADAGPLTASDIEKCLPHRTARGKWIKRSDTQWKLGNKPIVARLVEQDTMIIVRRVR